MYSNAGYVKIKRQNRFDFREYEGSRDHKREKDNPRRRENSRRYLKQFAYPAWEN